MPETQLSRQDLIEEARRLLGNLGEGAMSETAYDTAWVARVPNPHHPDEPLFPATYDWLLRNQHPDGSWGAEIPFAHDRLICTLAALVTLAGSSYRRGESEPTARRAVVYLNRERLNVRDDPHETVGFELLLPELTRQAQALDLRLPYEDWTFIEAIKADKLQRIPPIAVYGGPTTLTHSLEYLGDRLMPSLVSRCQGPNGSYGASPSATAYVLMHAPDDLAADYLKRVVSLSDSGGVMSAYTISIFELAWALRSLAPLRDELPELEGPLRRLADKWSPRGVSFTESGMVPDSDDTAVAILVLRMAGRPVDSDVLDLFEGEDHFFCYPLERNPSLGANAGILEVMRLDGSSTDRRRKVVKLTHYLRKSRIENQYWTDKWHVSPLYGTERAVSALAGLDPEVVRAAVSWILDEQHENGSWGIGEGTAEETAYALTALDEARRADPAIVGLIEPALQRGFDDLAQRFSQDSYPALWIEKGLYTPPNIVRAAVIGALARCFEPTGAAGL